MLYILIAVGLGIWICAIQAIRVHRLLTSAIWLAGASALVALMIYLLDAPEVAVIELSVGAGLVTVLFVFAINIAGEEELAIIPVLPKPLVIILIVVNAVLLIVLNLPAFGVELPPVLGGQFTKTMWQERGLDILLQIVLIYSGVLGVLGLLSEKKIHPGEEEQA